MGAETETRTEWTIYVCSACGAVSPNEEENRHKWGCFVTDPLERVVVARREDLLQRLRERMDELALTTDTGVSWESLYKKLRRELNSSEFLGG